MPTPAISVGISHEFSCFNICNFLFNFVDMPSCAIPVKLNENIDFKPKHHDRFTKIFEKEIKDSKELPLGIQIGALPQQDELVLRLMKDISHWYEFERVIDEKIYYIVLKQHNRLLVHRI